MTDQLATRASPPPSPPPRWPSRPPI